MSLPWHPCPCLAEHIPLKQGLRQHIFHIRDLPSHILAEHIPLKQGLRPYVFSRDAVFCFLAEHIPLKQGLRLIWVFYKTGDSLPRRAYSIKTRIKTTLLVSCQPSE